jgi:hypothetical protein
MLGRVSLHQGFDDLRPHLHFRQERRIQVGDRPFKSRGGRLSLDGDVDHLQLGEFRQALFAQLSPDSEFLAPPKGT